MCRCSATSEFTPDGDYLSVRITCKDCVNKWLQALDTPPSQLSLELPTQEDARAKAAQVPLWSGE